MEYVIGAILVWFAVYALLPTLWGQALSPLTKKWSNNGVVLTFDDGPNPIYTNEVIETLHTHDIKGVFFVLSTEALANAELIKKMVNYGNTIACHGKNHKCQWFMNPFQTFKDLKLATEELKTLGITPKYYRPPWGYYNLFTILACRKYNLIPVHWTIRGFDWKIYANTKLGLIRGKVMLHRWDIVLMHDNGGVDGAPPNTARMVKKIIEIIDKKGHKFGELK